MKKLHTYLARSNRSAGVVIYNSRSADDARNPPSSKLCILLIPTNLSNRESGCPLEGILIEIILKVAGTLLIHNNLVTISNEFGNSSEEVEIRRSD